MVTPGKNKADERVLVRGGEALAAHHGTERIQQVGHALAVKKASVINLGGPPGQSYQARIVRFPRPTKFFCPAAGLLPLGRGRPVVASATGKHRTSARSRTGLLSGASPS